MGISQLFIHNPAAVLLRLPEKLPIQHKLSYFKYIILCSSLVNRVGTAFAYVCSDED